MYVHLGLCALANITPHVEDRIWLHAKQNFEKMFSHVGLILYGHYKPLCCVLKQGKFCIKNR